MIVNSIAVSPKDFIETKRISPFISKFMVKAFYLGLSRKNFIIDREAGEKIAGTLRGSCVVGRFLEDEGDFGDHGISYRKIPFQDGYEKTVKTVPYGFVDLNAPIWFQDFKERDDDGKEVVRTYCCTEATIWTGLFPESKVLKKGENNQSIEMPGAEIEGEWAKIGKNQDPILIIHDAAIAKLCILGKYVEPCYEGSKFENVACSVDNEKEIEQAMLECLQNIKEDLEMSNSLNKDVDTNSTADVELNDKDQLIDQKEEKVEDEKNQATDNASCQQDTNDIKEEDQKDNKDLDTDTKDSADQKDEPADTMADNTQDPLEDTNNYPEGEGEEQSEGDNSSGQTEDVTASLEGENKTQTASFEDVLKEVVESFNRTLKTVNSTMESLAARVSSLEKADQNCSLSDDSQPQSQKMGEQKEKEHNTLQEYMKDIVLSMKDDYVFCSNDKDNELAEAISEANRKQD